MHKLGMAPTPKLTAASLVLAAAIVWLAIDWETPPPKSDPPDNMPGETPPRIESKDSSGWAPLHREGAELKDGGGEGMVQETAQKPLRTLGTLTGSDMSFCGAHSRCVSRSASEEDGTTNRGGRSNA